jgi:hypothetical protein
MARNGMAGNGTAGNGKRNFGEVGDERRRIEIALFEVTRDFGSHY